MVDKFNWLLTTWEQFLANFVLGPLVSSHGDKIIRITSDSLDWILKGRNMVDGKRSQLSLVR
jgi:hypothetical protein